MAEIYDQWGNVVRTVEVDHATGDFQTVMEMECEPLIAEIKAMRENQTINRKGEIFRLAAVVPAPIVEKSMIEGWFHDDKKWADWMNDGQNRDFRVYEGRI